MCSNTGAFVTSVSGLQQPGGAGEHEGGSQEGG